MDREGLQLRYHDVISFHYSGGNPGIRIGIVTQVTGVEEMLVLVLNSDSPGQHHKVPITSFEEIKYGSSWGLWEDIAYLGNIKEMLNDRGIDNV